MGSIVPSEGSIEGTDLNDYRYFAAVVDHGGFSAASRALGLPKSRLSRRVASLEARLGVRLLQRSTRKLVLTDLGHQVLAHSHAMLQAAQAAECAATRRRVEPSGRVRVSLPPQALDRGFSQVFEAYLLACPRVQLDLVLTSRRVDLIEEGIDIALRVRATDDEDPQWATRRLWPAQALLVAGPSLLAARGQPQSPADLGDWPALGAAGADRKVHWRLVGPQGDVRDVRAPLRVACEHFGLRARLAAAGLGVTMLPDSEAAPGLASGHLVRVLPGWAAPVAHVHAVYATQRGLPPAVRVLLEALAAARPEGVETGLTD